jgi:hypothetical protein
MSIGVVIPNSVHRLIDAEVSQTATFSLDVIKNCKILFYNMGHPEGLAGGTGEPYMTATILRGEGQTGRLLIVGKEKYEDILSRYPAAIRKHVPFDAPRINGRRQLGALLYSPESGAPGSFEAPSFITGLGRPLNQNNVPIDRGNRATSNSGFGGNRNPRFGGTSNFEVTGWQLIQDMTLDELAEELAMNSSAESAFEADVLGTVGAILPANVGRSAKPAAVVANALEQEVLNRVKGKNGTKAPVPPIPAPDAPTQQSTEAAQ